MKRGGEDLAPDQILITKPATIAVIVIAITTSMAIVTINKCKCNWNSNVTSSKHIPLGRCTILVAATRDQKRDARLLLITSVVDPKRGPTSTLESKV